MVNFLTEEFEKGWTYSYLNNLRSAVSSTASLWERVKVGQHPLVAEFMMKVERQRPIEPRYDETWKLDRLIEHIRANYPDNSKLSLEDLRKKAVALVMIAMVERSLDVERIKLSSLQFRDNAVNYLLRPPKNYKRGGSRFHPIFRVPDSPDVCPVEVLKEYISQMAPHKESSADHVFMTMSSPFKPIGSQRIAKIMLNEMKAAGIGVKVQNAFSAIVCCYKSCSTGYTNGRYHETRTLVEF